MRYLQDGGLFAGGGAPRRNSCKPITRSGPHREGDIRRHARSPPGERARHRCPKAPAPGTASTWLACASEAVSWTPDRTRAISERRRDSQPSPSSPETTSGPRVLRRGTRSTWRTYAGSRHSRCPARSSRANWPGRTMRTARHVRTWLQIPRAKAKSGTRRECGKRRPSAPLARRTD